MTQLLRRMQYPAYQGPVIFSASQAETVMESKWHQPWSDPMGTVFGKVRAAAAIALAASGLFAPVLTPEQTPEQVTESRWHQPWSEPYLTRTAWSRVALAASSGPSMGPVNVDQVDTPKRIAWFQPLSDPVRVNANRYLQAANQQAQFQGAVNVDPIDNAYRTPWYTQWTDPYLTRTAWSRVALAASSGLAAPVLTTGQFPEVVFLNWFAPLSDPVRVNANRYLQAANQQAQIQGPVNTDTVDNAKRTPWYTQWTDPYLTRTNQSRIALIASGAVISPYALTLPEAVLESKWHQPWSEPASTRTSLNPQMRVSLQSSFTISPAALIEPERITEDKWHYPWSEPVRLKSRLYLAAQAQQVFTTDPNPRVSFGWYQWLSDPVRVNANRYLFAGEQHYFEFEPEPPEQMMLEWYNWLSDPVRIKPGLRKELQQAFTTSQQVFYVPYARAYVIC